MLLRAVRHASRVMGRALEGEVVEIGGYGHPGLALAFLLLGARHYVLNNVSPVENRLPLEYAQNLYVLLQLLFPLERPLGDVVEPIAGTADVRVREPLITILREDAGRLGLPDQSVDVLLSITVLEHVPDTRPLVRNSWRLLKPGGWAYHSIDLRDHDHFDRPLEFLTWSDEEFARRQPGNNRMRFTDHLKVFEESGFKVDLVQYVGPLDVLDPQHTDAFHLLSVPMDEVFPPRVEAVPVWVTEEMRAGFDPRFRSYSLNELSVTGVNVGMRKPAKGESR